MADRRRKSRSSDDDDTPLLEWTFGAIGLALFTAAITITLFGLIGAREAPRVTVTTESAVQVAGLFRVEYAAFNAGDEAAADVHLVATLKAGEEIVESQEARIDLLPGGSTLHGGFFFRHNPSGLALEILPASYQDP